MFLVYRCVFSLFASCTSFVCTVDVFTWLSVQKKSNCEVNSFCEDLAHILWVLYNEEFLHIISVLRTKNMHGNYSCIFTDKLYQVVGHVIFSSAGKCNSLAYLEDLI